MSEATIPIKELMEKTEQWLLGQGYKKSTLGFYRATWNRFLSYSASPAYSRETAEQFLLQYFGVDVHAIDQTLDGRMRHARRHMNALDEIFRTGTVCRRKVYGVASIDDDCFDKFFSDYLSYCKMQNFSRSWMDNTIAALRLFLLAVHSSNTQNIKSINAETSHPTLCCRSICGFRLRRNTGFCRCNRYTRRPWWQGCCTCRCVPASCLAVDTSR